MSTSKKKKKVVSGEGFTLEGDKGLSLSLGSILRNEFKEDKLSEAGLREKRSSGEVSNNNENEVSYPSRVSVQRQTAGRGGKTVTAVLIPESSPVDRKQLAKEMRKGLGCGSFVEGGNVVLQGDLCDRAKEWLLKKGVKQVVSGN